MLDSQLKNLIRMYCPKWPALRRRLNRIKLNQINVQNMLEEDIQAGETSVENRRRVVEKYARMYPSRVQRLNELFDQYVGKSASLKARQGDEDLRNDMLFNCFAYGFMPDEYFVFSLEGKDPAQKREYLSDRDKDNISYTLNDIIDMGILLDKARTYQRFAPYYRREAMGVVSEKDKNAYMAFVEKHPVFVRKNVMLSKGDSVELVDFTHADDLERERLFHELVQNGPSIVEERIVQSACMNQLSLRSVNTVRCMSFLVNGEVRIGPCFLKVGQGDSFVDNAGAGGIIAGIDIDTGILRTNGFDEYTNQYTSHPDTGIVINGFQLPDWKRLRKLTIEMAMLMPTVRYIGWDLAHTENGWVVVEANGSGQFICPQIVWQRGFRRDIESLIK